MPLSEFRMFIEMMNEEFGEEGEGEPEADEPQTSADELSSLGVQVSQS